MNSNELILVMLIQGVGIFLTEVFALELIEEYFVRQEKKLSNVDRKLVLWNIIIVAICAINLFINCTFLTISERIDYGKGFFIAYLVNILFNSWIYKGAKYNEDYKKKQRVGFMIILKVFLAVFIIYTVAKHLIKF